MGRRKQGFTLVEVIVVLVILAVLAAILVPSMIGWINKAEKKTAVSECKRVVQALQVETTEEYSKGKLSYANLHEAMPAVLKLAEAEGSIEDMICDMDRAKITSLVYKAENGKYVLYENKTYTVYDKMPGVGSVKSYQRMSMSLLEKAASMSGNVWDNLRKLYRQEYGGDYPAVSALEKDILKNVSGSTLDSLTWKPTILGSSGKDGVMMVASNGTSANNAYLIYYNGNYYYHDNGYGKIDSSWISDKGDFNVKNLTDPPSSGSRWVKTEI
ncbi:MAG: prepilin-type N-terminal cleavage/methylation domain-containing protein [Eubacteriaceae bacterium]|nr:prepilin-type N-terminal cleavage/methylation domain-containing protein [Eubacteriaceae bacterium]